MGKSESQMDIVEKSTKSGKKTWTFVSIGLAVSLLLMTCAVVALVILYASSRGKEPGNKEFPSSLCKGHKVFLQSYRKSIGRQRGHPCEGRGCLCLVPGSGMERVSLDFLSFLSYVIAILWI